MPRPNTCRSFGTVCCVPSCKNNTKFNHNVSWHQFPKDLTLRKEWITRIQSSGTDDKFSKWCPTITSKICGAHFNKTGRKKYEDKLPSIFPHKIYEPKYFSRKATVAEAAVAAVDETNASPRKLRILSIVRPSVASATPRAAAATVAPRQSKLLFLRLANNATDPATRLVLPVKKIVADTTRKPAAVVKELLLPPRPGRICRLCLRSDKMMHPLFGADCAALNALRDVLQQVSFEGDGHPAQICCVCHGKLDAAQRFKTSCQLNFNKLRSTPRAGRYWNESGVFFPHKSLLAKTDTTFQPNARAPIDASFEHVDLKAESDETNVDLEIKTEETVDFEHCDVNSQDASCFESETENSRDVLSVDETMGDVFSDDVLHTESMESDDYNHLNKESEVVKDEKTSSAFNVVRNNQSSRFSQRDKMIISDVLSDESEDASLSNSYDRFRGDTVSEEEIVSDYVCGVCNVPYSTEATLNEHVETFHNVRIASVVQFRCDEPECSETFEDVTGLQVHKLVKHHVITPLKPVVRSRVNN